MILVDIYVPSVDETYDFMLEENVRIEQIILEVSEMISKKMREQLPEGNFLLCSVKSKKILDANETLHSSGMRDGSRLILL